MNVKQIIEHLLRGDLAVTGLFPHLDKLAGSPFEHRLIFSRDVTRSSRGRSTF